MFDWLKPLQKSSAPLPPANIGPVPVFAIGDVHGRVDLLRQLVGQLTSAAAQLPHTGTFPLVLLGDYVDRGFESRAVIEFFLSEVPPVFTPIFLKGNHEESLLDFLSGDDATGAAWLRYGGRETLYSYGVELRLTPTSADEWQELRLEFASKLPPRHGQFLQQLRLSYVQGDYAFVHAGIRPEVPLTAQTARDLLWIRDEFLQHPGPHPKRIVHGHTISPVPEIFPHRIGLDTGAYISGKLTGVLLQETAHQFFQTE